MLIGVFGDASHSPIIKASVEGLTKLGLPFRIRQNMWFEPRDGKDITCAFFQNATPSARAAFEYFRKIDVPCYFFDYGYFSRANEQNLDSGYFGINKNTWERYLVTGPKPADRFNTLGLQLKEEQSEGDYILVCGQDEGAGIDWAVTAYLKLKSLGFSKPILWRPHPRWKVDAKLDGVQSGEIDWSEVWFTVVRSSNMGNISLLNGVPIYSAYQFAMYHYMAFQDDHVCIQGDRQDYFNRLAYSQWSIDEIKSGEALVPYIKGEA